MAPMAPTAAQPPGPATGSAATATASIPDRPPKTFPAWNQQRSTSTRSGGSTENGGSLMSCSALRRCWPGCGLNTPRRRCTHRSRSTRLCPDAPGRRPDPQPTGAVEDDIGGQLKRRWDRLRLDSRLRPRRPQLLKTGPAADETEMPGAQIDGGKDHLRHRRQGCDAVRSSCTTCQPATQSTRVARGLLLAVLSARRRRRRQPQTVRRSKTTTTDLQDLDEEHHWAASWSLCHPLASDAPLEPSAWRHDIPRIRVEIARRGQDHDRGDGRRHGGMDGPESVLGASHALDAR